MAKNNLPLAKKRQIAQKINNNFEPTVDNVISKTGSIVDEMLIIETYITRASEINGNGFNKNALDEMKEQYNALIIDIGKLSFTPYVIS